MKRSPPRWRLSRAQQRDLERLFVQRLGGSARLSPRVVTFSMVTSLSRLHELQACGLLTFAEVSHVYRLLGVLAWDCRLTGRGQAALERELALEAS